MASTVLLQLRCSVRPLGNCSTFLGIFGLCPNWSNHVPTDLHIVLGTRLVGWRLSWHHTFVSSVGLQRLKERNSWTNMEIKIASILHRNYSRHIPSTFGNTVENHSMRLQHR